MNQSGIITALIKQIFQAADLECKRIDNVVLVEINGEVYKCEVKRINSQVEVNEITIKPTIKNRIEGL